MIYSVSFYAKLLFGLTIAVRFTVRPLCSRSFLPHNHKTRPSFPPFRTVFAFTELSRKHLKWGLEKYMCVCACVSFSVLVAKNRCQEICPVFNKLNNFFSAIFKQSTHNRKTPNLFWVNVKLSYLMIHGHDFFCISLCKGEKIATGKSAVYSRDCTSCFSFGQPRLWWTIQTCHWTTWGTGSRLR